MPSSGCAESVTTVPKAGAGPAFRIVIVAVVSPPTGIGSGASVCEAWRSADGAGSTVTTASLRANPPFDADAVTVFVAGPETARATVTVSVTVPPTGTAPSCHTTLPDSASGDPVAAINVAPTGRASIRLVPI